LRQEALAAEPSVLDRVRDVGKQHQRKVSTELGQQVQRAVFRVSVHKPRVTVVQQ
jgi:hypothetical protein